MVSTRQSSNVGSGGDHSNNDSGGIKTRHSAQNSQCHDIVPVGTSLGPPAENEYVSKLHFLDLPQEIFDKIFGYVGYKNVAQLRLVCRQFDRICSSILNSTFQRLQTQMLQRFQAIKAKMPRRESARRNHPLACESDIIETLHMRLTLLQMSFGKHIERKHCCFFAGEILDEVYRILYYIRVTPKLARPYRVTDELFDLSTMAMEYFKEKIEPTLPEISYFGTDFLEFAGTLSTTPPCKPWMLDSPPHVGSKQEYESPISNDERPNDLQTQPQSNTVLRKRIRKIKQGMKKYNSQLTLMKRELRICKSKMADQQKQFLEFATRMDEHDKKSEESSRKFSTLLQELNKCKTELQYWRSKSPLSSFCIACGKSVSNIFLPEEAPMPWPGSSFGGSLMPSIASYIEDPQPSTSTAEASQPWPFKEEQSQQRLDEKKQEEETKTRHSVSGKRKSTYEETSSSYCKKAKKPRSVLKVRKRS